MPSQKPRVITRCNAERFSSRDERLVEFSFPSLAPGDGTCPGGLICFDIMTTADGRRIPRVDVYRTEGQVLVLAPEKQPCAVPPRADTEVSELDQLRALALALAQYSDPETLYLSGQARLAALIEKAQALNRS